MCIKEYYISVHQNGNMLTRLCFVLSEKYQVLLIIAFILEGLQNYSRKGVLAING